MTNQITIRTINPANRTAIIAIEADGKTVRTVNVKLRERAKVKMEGGGVLEVRPFVVVGPDRWTTMKIDGVEQKLKLPQTFVLPWAQVQEFMGRAKKSAAA